MSKYQTLLEKVRDLHGEFCPGIVLGTRMCMLAMERLEMNPDTGNEDLVVYVEIDRCLPDAIQAITGCSLGNRRLKYSDYGKFIATFVDISSGKAVRVSALDDKIDSSQGFWTWLENILISTKPGNLTPEKEEIEFAAHRIYDIPDEELLLLEDVHLEIPENDMPGFPEHVAVCSTCGEHVVDFKEFNVDGRTICRSCTEKSVKLVVNQAYSNILNSEVKS
nr:FmdE family protein [uncultured Methanobacterium sp.]